MGKNWGRLNKENVTQQVQAVRWMGESVSFKGLFTMGGYSANAEGKESSRATTASHFATTADGSAAALAREDL